MKNLKRYNRIALVLALCVSMSSLAVAEDVVYPELKTSSRFSQVIQTITGITPLTGWIANRVIKRELSEHVQGDLHAKLRLYSATDLLGRKAKGFRMEGEDVLVAELFPISRFLFESSPETPLLLSKSSRPVLLRPVQFKAVAVLSEADINKMLQSARGQSYLTDMRVTLPPFGKQSFDALDLRVHFQDGKMVIETLMNIHGAPRENALPVMVSGRIGADRSRLTLTDLDIDIQGVEDSEAIGQIVEDYFSELVNLEKIKVERHRVKVAVDRTALQDGQLHVQATLTVTPDPKHLQKALEAF